MSSFVNIQIVSIPKDGEPQGPVVFEFTARLLSTKDLNHCLEGLRQIRYVKAGTRETELIRRMLLGEAGMDRVLVRLYKTYPKTIRIEFQNDQNDKDCSIVIREIQ